LTGVRDGQGTEGKENERGDREDKAEGERTGREGKQKTEAQCAGPNTEKRNKARPQGHSKKTVRGGAWTSRIHSS